MIVAFLANFLLYYLWKIEWIYVPDTDNSARTIKLFNSWQVKTQNYFWFNVNLLKKNFRFTLVGVLVNPTVWFLYVLGREKISNHWIHPNKISYDFPRNYPYVFFYRIIGQQAYEKDINYPHSLVSRVGWTFGTILVSCIIFFSLSYFLIKLKERFNHEKKF
jgi:hypothetical protein